MSGIPAKSKCDKQFEIDLPQNNYSNYSVESKFAERCGATYSGKTFNIEYILRVYVKHDSWNEMGEGNFVSFPISINQSPISGPYRFLPHDGL